jgi:hypothetical protein
VQRHVIGVLFAGIAVVLGGVAVAGVREGGRAWILAVAAAVLAVWMADLARRAWRR